MSRKKLIIMGIIAGIITATAVICSIGNRGRDDTDPCPYSLEKTFE